MPFQQLYKNIFDKNDTAAGAVAMLQQITRDHPYFSLAHFFLLKQANITDGGYSKIAAKTALHFNNTFLLQSQLHKNLQPVKSTILPAPAAMVEAAAEITTVEEALVVKSESEEVAQQNSSLDLTDTFDEHLQLNEEQLSEQTGLSSSQTDEQKISEDEVTGQAQATATPDTASETIKQPTLAAARPVPEGSLLFTPLFATDYFASQGIKLSQEALPNDKLGKQLKSFTDWLKTMKKVHDSKLPAGSEVLDLSVQKLAEKSNKEEEVITEAMAEVFLQQGKLHKAKEIYEKLSLLNPSKIAYFAAKIDQIQQK